MNKAVLATVAGAVLGWMIFIGLLWLLVQRPLLAVGISAGLLMAFGWVVARRRRGSADGEVAVEGYGG